MTMTDRHATILTPKSRHDDWLSAEELANLSITDICQRLSGLSDFIAAHATQAETLRHPVEAVWSEVRKSGLFYLLVPKQFGGLGGTDLQQVLDAILIIAESCASTAWCAAQGMQHQLLVGLYPDRFQKEIWGSLPYLTAAGSAFPLGKAVEVEGGFRLSGHYRWGSGILYSQWVFGYGAVDRGGSRPQVYCFFMPVEDVTILDTWHVDGIVGSGSHDFVADDVFVPTHRALDAAVLMQGRQDAAHVLQRLPLPVVAPIVVSLPILGAARSAVKQYRAKLATKGPDGTPGGRAAEHICLGRADLTVKIAEVTVRNVVDRIQTLWAQPASISESIRSELRGQCAYAAELSKQAVRSISDIAGSSAHLLNNPLQRALRDVTMLDTHTVLDPSLAPEVHGRLMIGLPANGPSETLQSP